MLAHIIALVQKMGRLKALSLRMPTPQAEAMFQDSFNKALNQSQHLLDDRKGGHLNLRDRNFDTGAPDQAGRLLHGRPGLCRNWWTIWRKSTSRSFGRR